MTQPERYTHAHQIRPEVPSSGLQAESGEGPGGDQRMLGTSNWVTLTLEGSTHSSKVGTATRTEGHQTHHGWTWPSLKGITPLFTVEKIQPPLGD